MAQAKTKAFVLNKKSENLVTKIFAIASVSIYAIFLATFLFGVASFYGKNVDLVQAISMVFGIFDMGSAYYRGIFGTGLGVVYIVLLVFLIKNLVAVIRAVCRVFSKKEGRPENDSWTLFLGNMVGRGFTYVLGFILACSVVKDFNFGFNTVVVVLLGSLSFLLTRVVLFLMQKYTLKSLFLQMGYTLLFFVSLVTIIALTRKPLVESVIVELRTALHLFEVDFQGCVAALATAAISGLYAFLLFFAFVCACNVNESIQYQKVRDFQSIMTFVYITSAIVSVKLVLPLLGGEGFEISHIISVIKEYIPLACATVALQLSTTLSADYSVYKLVAATPETASEEATASAEAEAPAEEVASTEVTLAEEAPVAEEETPVEKTEEASVEEAPVEKVEETPAPAVVEEIAEEELPALEEQTEFDVVLKEVGANKIAVTKVIMDATGLGLAEAKALVERKGVIKEKASELEAGMLMVKLTKAGAIVELK